MAAARASLSWAPDRYTTAAVWEVREDFCNIQVTV